MDNGYIFYGVFASTVGFIKYKLILFYVNSFYVDKGIQTDAWEDYSNRSSKII